MWAFAEQVLFYSAQHGPSKDDDMTTIFISYTKVQVNHSSNGRIEGDVDRVEAHSRVDAVE